MFNNIYIYIYIYIYQLNNYHLWIHFLSDQYHFSMNNPLLASEQKRITQLSRNSRAYNIKPDQDKTILRKGHRQKFQQNSITNHRRGKTFSWSAETSRTRQINSSTFSSSFDAERTKRDCGEKFCLGHQEHRERKRERVSRKKGSPRGREQIR